MRKKKAVINNAIRQRVFERDRGMCRYCGTTKGPFAIDHVYPESKGGETSIQNLVLSCKRCNTKKSSKIGIWPAPTDYFDFINTSESIRHQKNTMWSISHRIFAISAISVCLSFLFPVGHIRFALFSFSIVCVFVALIIQAVA